jgi:hypothetical protein
LPTRLCENFSTTSLIGFSYAFLNKHRNGKTNPDSYSPRSAAPHRALAAWGWRPLRELQMSAGQQFSLISVAFLHENF